MADISLSWRFDGKGTIHWLIEQMSSWHPDHTETAVAVSLRRRGMISAKTDAALARFSAWRRQTVEECEADRDPSAPVGAELLSEAGTPPRRLLADMIDAKISLPGFSEAALNDIHAALGDKIETARLDHVAQKLAQLAQAEKLETWLGRVAGFAWSDEAPEITPDLEVRLIWSPVPASATVFDHAIILPISPQDLARENWQQTILGVVVHEFGHWCVSRLSRQRRIRLTNQVLSAGLPNRYHINLVEEAIHTAIGNILFISETFGENSIGPIVYGYESQSEYPYAIDCLARAIAPELGRCLETEPSFGLADAIALTLLHQGRVLPPRPVHFTRIGVVMANDASARTLFQGVFPPIQRWELVGDNLAMAASFPNAPHLPRWVLWVGADPLPPSLFSKTLLDALEATRDSGQHTWCASMGAIPGKRAFEAVVWASSLQGMRDLLVQLHQAACLPTVSSPLTDNAELAETGDTCRS